MELDSPKIMGILNLTPDSFFDKSRVSDLDSLLRAAEKMISEGADILDMGGVSTRPGSEVVSEDEELRRLIPGIKELRNRFPLVPLSVDTFRSRVAREAVFAGASWVNDISGGTADPEMADTLAELQVPYVLMHMRGTPRTMQQFTRYENFPGDVIRELEMRRSELISSGINDIIIDPGFGFAKTVEQNFILLRELSRFRMCGHPLLVGISRKSMIWRTLGSSPDEALNGTTALHMLCLKAGADILRVHDVKAAKECVHLYQAMEHTRW
jgi:dihydropteroate synthase